MGDKRRIIEALRAALAEELAVVRAAAASAREGATHEDAQPENEYDTRALEQSYLAGAQTARAEVLAGALKQVEGLSAQPWDRPIGPGACVEVEDEDEAVRRYFLCDVAGGTRLDVDAERWWVLTPSSPLGRRLVGRSIGDVVEAVGRDGAELTITHVF
jgi:transcription elongation GreA/GreB family factor